MQLSILTLFPEMFQGPFEASIMKRAREQGLLTIELVNIRDYGIGKHKTVDDTAYGGGPGMVMRVDVLHRALEETKAKYRSLRSYSILLSADGTPFSQPKAIACSKFEHLILVCGHYEGVDERFGKYVDEKVSVGDFVVTGGEIPAMLIADAVVRLKEGVLKKEATENESFSLPGSTRDTFLLEYPHYTFPRLYDGEVVPPVLLSGNHKAINSWRLSEAEKKTKTIRPDLSPRSSHSKGSAE